MFSCTRKKWGGRGYPTHTESRLLWTSGSFIGLTVARDPLTNQWLLTSWELFWTGNHVNSYAHGYSLWFFLYRFFCHNSVDPFFWRQGKWFPVFKGIESNGWYYWWQMTMWHNFCGGHRNFAKWKPLAKVLSWLTNQWLIPSFFLPSTDIVLCLPTFVWYLPSYLCHILSNAMIYCCRPHLHGRKDKATMGSLQSMTFYSFT